MVLKILKILTFSKEKKTFVVMNFSFQISPKYTQQASEATKSAGNVFSLIFPKINNRKYDVSLYNFYLISNKIQKIINSDPTQEYFNLENDIYTEAFLDYFFTEIQNSFTIKIDENSLQQFIQLNNELEFNHLDKSIRTAVFQFLCQIFTNEPFSNDDKRLEFLLPKVGQIDPQIFLLIPEEIVHELISKSKFETDDEFARYLFQNEVLFKNFFQLINVDKITGPVMNEILDRLKYEVLPSEDQQFLNKIFERFKKQSKFFNSDYRKIIKILHVYANGGSSIDFEFIEDLNQDKANAKYFIHYKPILDTSLDEKLKNDNKYLMKFDVVVIGGCDSFAFVAKGITQNVFDNMKCYHNDDGVILLLHDVMYGPLVNMFQPLCQLLGYKRQNPLLGNGRLEFYQNVKFVESSEKSDMTSFPFEIGKSFEVAMWHHTPEYDPKFAVFNNGNDKNYYTENLDEKLANLELGHTTDIGINEQKFFYNAIVHLFEKTRNNHVKTKL